MSTLFLAIVITASQVLLGQRTVAGETIIAKTGLSELIEGLAQ